MKKIIISGCCNCPYLTVWNDGTSKGKESIVQGSCNHPSFNKELLTPYFSSTIFFKYQTENTAGERVDFSDVYCLKPNGMPEWCPLPNN